MVMTVVEDMSEVFSDMITDFDSWVLILHDDDKTPVNEVLIALKVILAMGHSAAMNVISEVESKGKAPVSSGTKDEMRELSASFHSVGLTTTVESA